ncbi:MAG: hypothetical protein M3133_08200 [Actinomycetota bacterium]|nr:hypothetical protein [Actinomycetota bacterium]
MEQPGGLQVGVWQARRDPPGMLDVGLPRLVSVTAVGACREAIGDRDELSALQ